MRTILKISIRADLRLEFLLLLTGSRSRFRVRNYISSLAWGRLISFIRSGFLRVSWLGVGGHLGRRGLTFRILRGSLFGRILLSTRILWRSSRFFRAVAVVRSIRQAWLIRRHDSLRQTRKNLLRSNYRHKHASWLLRCVANLLQNNAFRTFFLDNFIASQFSELLR